MGGGAVDAEVAGGGEIDEILRVDCAVEMVVEISTFGQVAQEGQEQSGLFANGVEVTGGALLGGLGRGEGGEKKEQEKDSPCRALVRRYRHWTSRM